MAPLEGVTDRTFRSCYYDHFSGLSASVTPFLPIPDRVKRVSPATLRMTALPGETRVPEIPQLLVSESSAFITAARALEAAGFTELNWNLGCPSRGVVRKGKGAGLLPDTEGILNILDKAFSCLDIKISMKIRLGMDNREESFRLLPELKGFPLAGLTLHPRLGKQMYSGSVDLEGFDKALELYGKPICYNGDIRTVRDYADLKKKFPGQECWMIGRGLMADPLLPRKILEYDETGRAEDGEGHPLGNNNFRIFIEDLLERMKRQFSRETALLNYLKGILVYTFNTPPMPADYRHRLVRLKNLEEWELFKNEIYGYLDSQ